MGRDKAASSPAQAKTERRPKQPLPDRKVLTCVLFVTDGQPIPWEMLPQEIGCGSGTDVLATRGGKCRHAGVWKQLHQVLLDGRGEADKIDWSRPLRDGGDGSRPRGAPKPGAKPTGSGKQGTKRHLVVDKNRDLRALGARRALAVTLSAANVHDSTMMETTLDAIDPTEAPPSQAQEAVWQMAHG